MMNPLHDGEETSTSSDDEAAVGATRSRLEDLQRAAAHHHEVKSRETSHESSTGLHHAHMPGHEVELGAISPKEEREERDRFMVEFFREVDEVKAKIGEIQKASRRIREIADERTLAVSNKAESALSAEMVELVDATNATVKKTKALLEKMAEAKSGPRPSEKRIRDHLSATLHRKFCDVARDYQHAQQTHKAEITKTVRRQLEIVQPGVSADDIDAAVKNGVGQVYQNLAINDPVQAAYADVADKYQDVLKLEQSVRELHQMFLDFALLTEQQGDLLDQIEYQVKAADEYIQEGNLDIEKALLYQQQLRQRACCVLVLLLLLLLVLLLVTGAFDQGNDD